MKTVPKLNWKAPQMTHNSNNKLFKMTLRKIRKLDIILQVLIGGIELGNDITDMLVTVILDVGDSVHEFIFAVTNIQSSSPIFFFRVI